MDPTIEFHSKVLQIVYRINIFMVFFWQLKQTQGYMLITKKVLFDMFLVVKSDILYVMVFNSRKTNFFVKKAKNTARTLQGRSRNQFFIKLWSIYQQKVYLCQTRPPVCSVNDMDDFKEAFFPSQSFFPLPLLSHNKYPICRTEPNPTNPPQEPKTPTWLARNNLTPVLEPLCCGIYHLAISQLEFEDKISVFLMMSNKTKDETQVSSFWKPLTHLKL